MAKLYPPIISGTLPAFYLDTNSLDRNIKITVPFTMNRSVSANQVKGFALKIKTVQNSEYLYTAYTYNKVAFNLEGSSYVDFILSTSNNSEERSLILKTLKVGLFYKIQIAYIDNNNEVGNFSTVGISKYTTKPKVEIKGLSANMNNNHIYNYIGTYDQGNGDNTEKVYSYCFNIYDVNDNLIATSGENIHNTTTDTELNFSYDEFNYMKDFEIYKPYKIQYSIQTNNNLQLSSPLYKISQKVTAEAELKADIVATADFNDGYISVDLIGHKNNKNEEIVVTGSFILSRASELDNYTNWEKLSTFKLVSERPTRHLINDFTAEQGRKYKYSIQQYNDNGLYSSRIFSNVVFSDFEDIFLYDGNKQLKIRFNPKLGNVKTNLAESKIDTLGSKYPFFFKNSKINYKEFSISGLLSYLEDDKFFFINEEELFLPKKEYRQTTTSYDIIEDQVALNVARERLFKTKVLEWLNDGEPKLFRSPYEGNFIVRLMKVTLNPENKLGRLLHTFNGTAYEVAEYNYENLIKYNFVKVIQNQDIQYLSWKTVNFALKDSNGNVSYPIGQALNHKPTNNIKIMGMRPGQMVALTFENNKTEIIVIGATGSYSLNSQIAIAEIKLLESNLKYTNGVEDSYLSGSLTYSYYGTTPNEFNKISNIENIGVPIRQFIGEHNNILREIKCVKYQDEWLDNPKQELLKIFKIRCRKRDVDKVRQIGDVYYYEQTDAVYDTSVNKSALILIGDYQRSSAWTNPKHNRCNYTFIPSHYCDLLTFDEYKLNSSIEGDNQPYNPTVTINGILKDDGTIEGGRTINLKDIDEFEFSLDTFDEIDNLSCGNGAIVEISYYIKNTDFAIEDSVSYPNLYDAKQSYTTAVNELERYYEIISILGQYNGDYGQAELYLNTIKDQLTKDANDKTKGYKDRKETLEQSYNDLYKEDAESNIYTAHLEMVAYLESKIAELKLLTTETAKKELDQYQQALYVENYEYERQKQIKYNQLQKQLNELQAKISEIETKAAQELQSIKEQSILSLSAITLKKNEILNEILENYDLDNLDTHTQQWIDLREILIQNINDAYAKLIYELIIAQQYEKAEEEQFYD